MSEVEPTMRQLRWRKGYLVLGIGLSVSGCTPGFFRLSTDSWVAEGGCAGTLTAELLESTGTGFEDRMVYRLRSGTLPQGKQYTLQLRKADGSIAGLGTVFVGEDGVIQSDEDGKDVDVVLSLGKMLPNEPVGAGISASDGSCARTVIVPRGKDRQASK